MKKIISLILLLMFALMALVSCGSDELTEMPEHYPKDIGLDDYNVVVDMYVIVGDGTTKTASDNVASMITKKTLSKYGVNLNIVYLTEAEYENKVLSDAVLLPREYTENVKDANGQTKEVTRKAGTVVLVPNEAFMSTLLTSGATKDARPLNLMPYMQSTAYGALNVMLPDALIAAAKTEDALYAIPNNRILGEYTYLLINEEIAIQQLKYSPNLIASYKTYESTEELRQSMTDNNLDPSLYVKVQNGTYDDKAKYEAEGYVCNIISNPQVTKADAFASAFAILDSGVEKVNDGAMKIIYALNSDSEIRNMLEYGIEFTHYNVVDGKVVRETSGDVYNMNPLYTGNAFIMFYCDEYDWNEAYATMGKKQNDAAIFAE